MVEKKCFPQKNFGSKKCWSKDIFLSKNFLDTKFFYPKFFYQNNFWSTEIFQAQKILVTKNFGSKNLGPKNYGPKKLIPNILGPLNFESKTIWGPTIFFGSKRFGLNKIFDQTKFWCKACKKIGFKKFGSVTAEIFAIWTNVAKTHVSCFHDSWSLSKMVPGTYF